MPTKKSDAYAKAGVDYGVMDPIKVLAQNAARSTAGNLTAFGMSEVAASRGESAYVWEEQDGYRALVVEGLGTKNLVADAMRTIGGRTYYDQIAQDTVAMIVNDLIVVGAMPLVVNAYFAIGDSAWLADHERAADLIRGWAEACSLAGAAWGGGETPTLKGIINPETIDLGGSAVGIIIDKSQLVLGDGLAPGDAIILIASSGIHANGLTMARAMADKAPDGYGTKLTDGRSYGEALLTPTPIYVPLVRALQSADIPLHYMVNITGHGWRKLMRANQELTYTIETMPPVPAELAFIKSQSGSSDEDMYGNFNMGAGFAVYVPQVAAKEALATIEAAGFKAWQAGLVSEGQKQVNIKPLGLTFQGDSLGVR